MLVPECPHLAFKLVDAVLQGLHFGFVNQVGLLLNVPVRVVVLRVQVLLLLIEQPATVIKLVTPVFQRTLCDVECNLIVVPVVLAVAVQDL